ncbi:barwin-like endoglucanase [Dendrothele bispora CBS 962.96]|uniref:Barwin-like endoglucanase n=1 Tax=Dendrothele bispora (strain CBS 962.96) TaxID=1314807 RepID=A0A4S8LKH6_DENBC|nr:barwin-like endoglucanase [Dendrothele bispora CBS 962.96]
MFSLSLFSATTLALFALNTQAFVVPRTNPPPGWATGYLEDYQVYHTRYLALGCQFQHGKPFFDSCCHPMLATENLKDNRAPECTPSPDASASAAAVVATEDCEDEDADESTPAPTSTATPTPEPSFTPEPSSAPEPSSSSTDPAPSPSPSPSSSSSDNSVSTGNSNIDVSSVSNLITGGFGTFFYQNGVAGACGTVHSDSDFIVAMDTAQYGDTSKQSDLCGKQVQIFNAKNNKSVTCTIADACPTCNNGNSIDLSVGAFQQLADLSEGLIDIKWKIL